MKKIVVIISIILFTSTLIFSQSPQAFKYQAVARDSSGGILANQSVSFRISIIKNNISGNAVYSETHTPTTNNFGLVNLNIGGGSVISGTFSNIDWGNDNYFVKIELDAKGGTNYQLMGTSQLLSVPFALYAEKTGNVDDADADSTNELQVLSIYKDTLHITDGNFVNLDVDRVDRDSMNELQTLSISGNQLQISKGNSVTFSGAVDLDADPTNELQNISISNDSLHLSRGGSVKLPNGSGVGAGGKASLADFDNDFSNVYKISSDLLWVNGFEFDSTGNIYITGNYQGTLSIGNKKVSSKGENDIFIAKFDSTKSLIWIQSAGGNGYDNIKGLDMDNSGNLYITGGFTSTATFGSITLTSNQYNSDIFIAKYDNTGNILWAQSAGNNANYGDYGNAITIDKFLNVFITGKIGKNAIFNNDTVNKSGNENIFIAKYNNSGVYQWVKNFHCGQYNSSIVDIEFDNSGNFFVAGAYQDSLIIDNDTLKGQGNTDIFILKFDNTENYVWSKTIGGNNWESQNDIIIDDSGSIYLTGFFNTTFVLDSIYIFSPGQHGSFIAKFDNSGRIQWANSFGSYPYSSDNNIVLEKNRIFIAGAYYSSLIVDDTIHYSTNPDYYNFYLLEYDYSGRFIRFRDLDFCGTIGTVKLSKSKNSLYLLLGIQGAFYNKGIRYNPGTYILKL